MFPEGGEGAAPAKAIGPIAKAEPTGSVWLTVLVAALGYFVDIYDLILFLILRVKSLKGIGVPPDQILDRGVLLLNMQMIGMLVGGCSGASSATGAAASRCSSARSLSTRSRTSPTASSTPSSSTPSCASSPASGSPASSAPA